YLFFLLRYDPHRHLPSFPTRRSSDLILSSLALLARLTARLEGAAAHHVMRLVLASLTLNLARYVLLLLGGEGFIHEASPPQKREAHGPQRELHVPCVRMHPAPDLFRARL